MVLESALIAALIWGEAKLGPRKHFFCAVGVFVGSWLSGYFIVTTNAFMQYPVEGLTAARLWRLNRRQ